MKKLFKEIATIILATIILGLVVSYPSTKTILAASISLLIIITLNILAKKSLGHYFEAKVNPKFWSWYQYWFTKRSHFKKPVPMLWLPLLVAFLSQGLFWWLAILEFDVSPKTERVSRRHGLYRFSEMTDWHIALIATAGIVINLLASIVGYLLGFEFFARLSIFYAFWSIIPLSSLDGSKIFFGSRALWITIFIITSIFLGYSLIVV